MTYDDIKERASKLNETRRKKLLMATIFSNGIVYLDHLEDKRDFFYHPVISQIKKMLTKQNKKMDFSQEEIQIIMDIATLTDNAIGNKEINFNLVSLMLIRKLVKADMVVKPVKIKGILAKILRFKLHLKQKEDEMSDDIKESWLEVS